MVTSVLVITLSTDETSESVSLPCDSSTRKTLPLVMATNYTLSTNYNDDQLMCVLGDVFMTCTAEPTGGGEGLIKNNYAS